MNVGEALRAATVRLSATSDTARLDAEVLMAHALGCSRTDLLLRHMAAPVPDHFDALIERWIPLTYLLNSLTRSLGQNDAYPFVLTTAAIGKLRFVHDCILEYRREQHPERPVEPVQAG